jgi:aminopeptidase N
MLYDQLENKDDVIGRLRAIEALEKKKDKKTIAKLKEVLNGDLFYGVRGEASKALRNIHTNDAFDALVESFDQPDARVRLQVVRNISGFYRPESFRRTKRVLRSEKNPEILYRAIRNLGKYHHKDTRRLLMDYLKSRSYRNKLAVGAVQAIRMLDEPFFISLLQRTLGEREQQFTSWDFARGLDTLAHISRNEDDKAKVRNFLAGYVNNPKKTIQTGAIKALGTLGDTKAIPIVETFSGDDAGDRLERSAKNALKALREKKQLVPEEITQLRETVEGLRKENEKLRNEVEDIKKRLDAKEKSEENPEHNQ